jgi:hypothetical protein
MCDDYVKDDGPDCVVDSCGYEGTLAAAYRLGGVKLILRFCEGHFDATMDDVLERGAPV